jgi:monofunctional biosynthetic peptidoglycan transglycosylase
MRMAKRASSIPSYRRKRKGRGFLGWLWRIILGLFLLSILWVLAYRFVPPPVTATMLGDLFAGRGIEKDWMSLDEMDRDMVRAAIAAEDSKFCQHSGFDFEAIEDAMKRNASGGRIRGGSTISQQTAKNAFLWGGGGYARKGVEAYFTFLIEHLWGKRRIMEVYLNVAETGIGTYGANAGSMRYFGHDASAMSATEAARIAAILPLPKKRGAIAPKGFTRRYGNTIAARIGQVRRDGLDACVYKSATAPKDKAPPPSKAPRELPGSEYETATPPPPEASVDLTPVEEPAAPTNGNAVEATPAVTPDEPAASPPPTEEPPPQSPPPPAEPQAR